MAMTYRLITRGMLVALAVFLAVAVGLHYATRGAPLAEAQVVDGIVQVTPEEGNSHGPAVVYLAATGQVLTVYEYYPPEQPGGLFYKKSTDDGATWSAPTLVTQDANSAAWPGPPTGRCGWSIIVDSKTSLGDTRTSTTRPALPMG